MPREVDIVDDAESLEQVKRLLGLLPGVEVVWTQQSPSLVRLGLAVRSPRSLARLAHITYAANVLLVVEVDWGWRGKVDDPECVRYDLRIPPNPERTEPPTTLQIVGIYLARDLKATQLLDAEEADRLQEAWNAMVM
jgi:hypothetical protein